MGSNFKNNPKNKNSLHDLWKCFKVCVVYKPNNRKRTITEEKKSYILQNVILPPNMCWEIPALNGKSVTKLASQKGKIRLRVFSISTFINKPSSWNSFL